VSYARRLPSSATGTTRQADNLKEPVPRSRMGKPAQKKKSRVRNSADYATQVDLFAREFQSEDHLRKVVADLFRKMGHAGVKITHGPNEKGKDIIFYSSGPLGEKRLFACVVKNDPITGRADDHHAGAPTIVNTARTVTNQIQAAFNEPLPDAKGADAWVDSVYVISPYESSPAAVDSVKTTLQRSGQIFFICGQALLELFAKHWPEFLWFESTVLVSYLSALRKNIESDYALANLILQKSAYLEASSSSSFDLYVKPTFYRELRPHRLTIQELLTIRLLTGPRYLSEIQDEANAARRVDRLLHAALNGVAELKSDKSRSRDLDEVAKGMLELWESGYRRRVAELRAQAAKSGGSGQGFAASGAFTADAFIPPKRSEITVDLKASAEFTAKAEAVTTAADAAVTQLRAQTIAASQFASGPAAASPLTALASTDFLGYCKIAEVAEIIPEAFAVGEPLNTLMFDEKLLDRFDGCLLMTGAAGFGKTAFCRWHAIRDANRLVAKQASVLPVYRALYPLSNGKLGSFEEAFFASEELRKLIQQQSAGQAPFTRIRLYLDGLDEVTSHERQCEILKLAAEGVQKWKFLQILVTGRDHVSGADLRWLPRIRLCELSDAKIRLLAERWLGQDRLDGFFQRLTGVGTLSDLMKVPLLATLILAVYRKTGSVPPNKTNLYSLFVELLCGGWDFYKNVQRRPSRFSTRDKEVALTRLAGMLQHDYRRDATEADFRNALNRSLSFLSREWEPFMQEIIEDGLLVRVGKALTFAHHSFQEFLTARDLRDHQGTRPKQALGWYFNGKDWWRESLAFYVTLLDRPGDTDEWVIKRALVSTATSPDLKDRVIYLRECIQAAFPAYEETIGARTLSADLDKKLARISGAAHETA
jgi:hypothetical protein